MNHWLVVMVINIGAIVSCAKTAEPIEMLGRLVWRHSRWCRYSTHPHMLYRPIEWPPTCAKMAELMLHLLNGRNAVQKWQNRSRYRLASRLVTFSGSWGVPLSYGKPDFHGVRTFLSWRFWGFMVKVTTRSTGSPLVLERWIQKCVCVCSIGAVGLLQNYSLTWTMGRWCAKMVEPIEMLFGHQTRVIPWRNFTVAVVLALPWMRSCSVVAVQM